MLYSFYMISSAKITRLATLAIALAGIYTTNYIKNIHDVLLEFNLDNVFDPRLPDNSTILLDLNKLCRSIMSNGEETHIRVNVNNQQLVIPTSVRINCDSGKITITRASKNIQTRLEVERRGPLVWCTQRYSSPTERELIFRLQSTGEVIKLDSTGTWHELDVSNHIFSKVSFSDIDPLVRQKLENSDCFKFLVLQENSLLSSSETTETYAK